MSRENFDYYIIKQLVVNYTIKKQDTDDLSASPTFVESEETWVMELRKEGRYFKNELGSDVDSDDSDYEQHQQKCLNINFEQRILLHDNKWINKNIKKKYEETLMMFCPYYGYVMNPGLNSCECKIVSIIKSVVKKKRGEISKDRIFDSRQKN